MGRSKRPDSRQRAAGGCKAVGKSAEIPPGVAFLNGSREGRGSPGTARGVVGRREGIFREKVPNQRWYRVFYALYPFG